MAAPKGWRAIKTVWYVVGSGVFIFAAMASLMVLLGFAGTNGNQQIAGLFTMIVFWYASSTYRKKGLALMDEALKEQQGKDNDEHSDDSF